MGEAVMVVRAHRVQHFGDAIAHPQLSPPQAGAESDGVTERRTKDTQRQSDRVTETETE